MRASHDSDAESWALTMLITHLEHLQLICQRLRGCRDLPNEEWQDEVTEALDHITEILKAQQREKHERERL